MLFASSTKTVFLPLSPILANSVPLASNHSSSTFGHFVQTLVSTYLRSNHRIKKRARRVQLSHIILTPAAIPVALCQSLPLHKRILFCQISIPHSYRPAFPNIRSMISRMVFIDTSNSGSKSSIFGFSVIASVISFILVLIS